MKKLFIVFFLTSCALVPFAQQNNFQCYPTNWWAGMKFNKLQLMIHGEGIANAKGGVSISYPGISLSKINKVENPNYLFLAPFKVAIASI